MKQQADHTPTERQRLNLKFSEERIELLNTIRDMIDIEFERRGMNMEGGSHPEQPPPKPKGRTPANDPDGEKPPSPTLWQRIASLFKRKGT